MKNSMILLLLLPFLSCTADFSEGDFQAERIRVILDTDANNELDDQHAIAYLLFNGDVFDVEGITVNRTFNGGAVEKHFEEAERVVKLCNLHPDVRVYTGADGNFEEIRGQLGNASFDGAEAVNFIIERARATTRDRLVLLPVGKLTNIALALEKDPSIAEKVRIVWLGSNYPDPGEYNQDNDEASMNYILDLDVPFEMVTVRYGKPSGTDAVRASLEEIKARMPGLGPRVEPVVGRHGESFTTFGDYSVDLFKNIDLHGDPPSRALFDMAAVAIVKNPDWAEAKTIPAPILVDRKWQERPANQRTIVLWENFDRKAIMDDFYSTMENPSAAD
jgi:purine nucleosidase